MIVFSPPPRSRGRSSIEALGAPLTAAGYLRLRRTARGLSRRELALRLSSASGRGLYAQVDHRPPNLDEAVALVDMLETDGARARYRHTIEAIGAFVPLDADVYRQLAEEPAERHPQVCRGCGCSDGLVCTGDLGVCSWALPNLCVTCLDRRATAAGDA